jgi:hypothetical protein
LKVDKITLRWRIHEGEIPLRRRHLKALEPLNLPAPLMGWIHERLEWAAINMLDQNSEGVLVLNIDPETEVVASLEEVRETPALTVKDLTLENGFITGVQFNSAPLQGVVWSEREGTLYASTEQLTTATATLARDLAQTLNLPVKVHPQTLEQAHSGSLFLISDEFGLIPIQSPTTSVTPATSKLQECFAKLW